MDKEGEKETRAAQSMATLPLHFQSARAQAAAVRDGRITALQLCDLHIDRIRSEDPAVNAVVVRCFETARDRARALDAMVGPVGPLHGVPFTVKESWWVEGTPATNGGIVKLRGFVCSSNAPLVQLLLDAGAVLLGKTNLPTHASDWQSYNDLYGTTNNPYALKRTPGGSSGGSAAAVASGFGAFDLGTDIAGSIRIPAHFCGVCGHKPSQGLLSFAGSAPSGNHWTIEPRPSPAKTRYDPVFHQKLQVAGPIARSCADLALLMQILAQPDPAQVQAGLSLTLCPPRVTLKRSRGLRIAVWSHDVFCPVDEDCRVLIERAASVLGAAITCALVGLDARPTTLESKNGVSFFQHSHRHYDTVLRAALHTSPILTHEDVEYAQRKRQGLKEAWSLFFEKWDVLFCPVSPTPAFVHDHSERGGAGGDVPCVDGRTDRRVASEEGGVDMPYTHQNRWAGLTIFPDLPVTVLPVGRVRRGGEQLPVGMQIVGSFGHDLQTIEVGRILESVGGEEYHYRPPPGRLSKL